MIILVEQRVEPVRNVQDALAVLIGSGVVSTFQDPDDPENTHPDPFRVPVTTRAISVICDDSKAGYAKAGFYEAGFQVPTATGAAHDPGESDPVTLTVTPAKEDDVKYYPVGIGPGAIMAAKALHGAFVTRSIGDDQAFIGDNPETSIQVRCNKANIPAVQNGFRLAFFNTVQV